ncbi:hypothetical protein C8R43DRAFT_1116746 [Mycena crocata]|nr:hypothetical protein C8R43DRAFT_1116746 [Mycena crocata]
MDSDAKDTTALSSAEIPTVHDLEDKNLLLSVWDEHLLNTDNPLDIPPTNMHRRYRSCGYIPPHAGVAFLHFCRRHGAGVPPTHYSNAGRPSLPSISISHHPVTSPIIPPNVYLLVARKRAVVNVGDFQHGTGVRDALRTAVFPKILLLNIPPIAASVGKTSMVSFAHPPAAAQRYHAYYGASPELSQIRGGSPTGAASQNKNASRILTGGDKRRTVTRPK